jgi:hypothetical protein
MADSKKSRRGRILGIIGAVTVAVVAAFAYAIIVKHSPGWLAKDLGVSDASSAGCDFSQAESSCESSDGSVAVSLQNTNNQDEGCTYNYVVNWGDNSETNAGGIEGNIGGTITLGTHTYTSPQIYTITVQATVTLGDCNAPAEQTYAFTLGD